MITPIAIKFVTHDVPPLESLKDTEPYRLKEALISGRKLTRQEKDRLYELTREHHGYHRLYGWSFNFREYMHIYWVKFKYYPIEQVCAPDKMSIRNCHGSQVEKIVQVS